MNKIGIKERNDAQIDSINEEDSNYSGKEKETDEEELGRRIMKANYDSELQKMKKIKPKEKLSFTKKLLGLMGCCTDR